MRSGFHSNHRQGEAGCQWLGARIAHRRISNQQPQPSEFQIRNGDNVGRGFGRKSSVRKRSIFFAGYKTSVSLEDEFWKSLKQIARERGMSLGELVRTIDANRNHANLSSAIRLFVLGVYRDQRR